MKRAALALILIAAACRTIAGPDDHADAARAGAKLFDDHCTQCHGANAEGRNAPALATANVAARSDQALFAFITNGDLRRGMPSWSRLTEQRRWQIVAYLRSISRR